MSLPSFAELPLLLQLALLTLTSFRITRFIISDQYPPIKWFREWVDKRCGTDSGWAELVNCGWCSSPYVAVITFALVLTFPGPATYPVYILSTLAIVGYLSNFDD